jgi:peptidoglycan/LPS O-acetylase OafA/YrhL
MAQSARFERLDAVRGAAILWVVVFHICGACWGWDFQKWPVRLLTMGSMGVPMFFVLSGFLIHYTASSQPTSIYLLRRFGRIYPPYFVALVVMAAVYGTFWTARGRGDLLSHGLLVHTLKDSTFFSINASFWSLAHEAQFYLLYPLLLHLRRFVGMPTLVWGALALRLGIGVWLKLAGITAAQDPGLYYMLPRLYFEWILGMYVADSVLAGGKALLWRPEIGWLLFGCAYLTNKQGWLDLAAVPAISLATAIWIARIVHVPREPSRLDRVLVPLGVVSYSLYLWHQPIVNELCFRIFRAPNVASPAVLFATALAVCFFASLVVAVGAYRLVEVPSLEFTRRFAKWLESRQETRAVISYRRAA